MTTFSFYDLSEGIRELSTQSYCDLLQQKETVKPTKGTGEGVKSEDKPRISESFPKAVTQEALNPPSNKCDMTYGMFSPQEAH